MVTLAEAKSLTYGTILHTDGHNRFRVAGAVKTWKRNDRRVYVPLKRGLYEYGFLDETRLGWFHREDGCTQAAPVNARAIAKLASTCDPYGDLEPAP